MNESPETLSGEAGRLLGASTLLGGKLLRTVVQNLLDCGVAFPLEESEALKYRGIGRVAAKQLRELGLVKDDPYVGLTDRAPCCLMNAGVENKEQVKAAIESGKLNPGKSPRNYGWKTHKQVCKWAGLPEPHKPVRVQICPHCGNDVLLPPNDKAHARRPTMNPNAANAETLPPTQERGVFACSVLLQRRVCRSCQTEKPDSDFYAHPLGIRGRRATCKTCCKKWNRTQKHRDACRRWDAENHQKKSAIAKAYKSTPNGHSKRLANKRKDRAEISRTYVIKSLTQHTALKTNDVPAPLIAAAQAVIKLKRTLWQNRKT